MLYIIKWKTIYQNRIQWTDSNKETVIQEKMECIILLLEAKKLFEKNLRSATHPVAY